MHDERGRPALGPTISASLALTLVLAAAHPALADGCTPPKPNPRVTSEILRRQGGDTSPLAVAAVNALYANDDCLRQAAYDRRNDHDPLRRTATRLLAVCATSLQAYEALQAKAAPSRAALAEERSDTRRKTAEIAFGYARDYRECAK